MRVRMAAGFLGLWLVACGGKTSDETSQISGNGAGQAGSGQAGQAGSGQAGAGQAGAGAAGKGGGSPAGAAGVGPAGAAGVGPGGQGGVGGAGPGCCKTDGECGGSAPMECVLGDCKLRPAPGQCWRSDDCGDGQSCVGALPCPCGKDCTEDSPGVCQNVGPGCCEANLDCPQGGTVSEVCANGVCKSGPWTSVDWCWTDSMCLAGFKCEGAFVCPCGAACDQADVAGKCVPQGPGCCKTDLDCGDFAQMYCVEGVCKLPAKPKGCWVDAECPAGQTCEGESVCPCGALCGLVDAPGTCQGASDWGACAGAGSCRLAFDSCCGPCGTPKSGDYDGVNYQQLDAHFKAVCPSPDFGCPACVQGMNADLAPLCVAGKCQVIEVSKSDLSACTKDDECSFHAAQCCECGQLSPEQYVAVRADKVGAYEVEICGSGGGGCMLDCAPQPPPGLAAFCDKSTGHCALKF